MKKFCIFAKSNSLIRGPRLAHKAGFFHVPVKGEFRLSYGGLPIPSALEAYLPAKVDCLTSGIWWAAFLFLPVTSNSPQMEFQLKDGKVAIIDEEDYSRVNGFFWVSKSEGKRTYAVMLHTGVRMHRLIMRAKRGQIVDHVNGNGLDNRKANLRFCTDSQNQCNRGSTRGSAVPFKGVSYDKKRGKFSAQIQFQYKAKHLGFFDCPFKAARAYDAAAKELHGEFANLNFKQKSK